MRASIGMVLLTYQIGYFNILPLYVVLLLIATVFVVIARFSLLLALAASVALYAATLTFQLGLPSWPAEGAWFFNPLSWQLLIVLGYVAMSVKREHPTAEDLAEARLADGRWPSFCSEHIIVWVDYRPDPHGRSRTRVTSSCSTRRTCLQRGLSACWRSQLPSIQHFLYFRGVWDLLCAIAAAWAQLAGRVLHGIVAGPGRADCSLSWPADVACSTRRSW